MSTESDQQQKVAARILVGYAAAVLIVIILVVGVGRLFHVHMSAWHPVQQHVTFWHFRANPQ